MKKIYFGSNLKMYKGIRDTAAYLQMLEKLTLDIDRSGMELFIIPSFTALETAAKSINHENILLGAQNMCWEETGQFTGEISPLMLKELGADMVMIGHSERRHVFGETDVEENKKIKTSLEHGFITLLCVGETAEEKQYGIAEEILRKQLIVGFKDVSSAYAKNIRVAYEPVWSIGVNGEPAAPEYARARHREIKKCLSDIFGSESEKIPVLYGGSVNPQNAGPLIRQPGIDGLFVGRAAWEAEGFNALIRMAMEALGDCISGGKEADYESGDRV